MSTCSLTNGLQPQLVSVLGSIATFDFVDRRHLWQFSAAVCKGFQIGHQFSGWGNVGDFGACWLIVVKITTRERFRLRVFACSALRLDAFRPGALSVDHVQELRACELLATLTGILLSHEEVVHVFSCHGEQVWVRLGSLRVSCRRESVLLIKKLLVTFRLLDLLLLLDLV